VRNGLNFIARDFGVRDDVVVSDRGLTAISQMTPTDINWNFSFDSGVHWFHTSGIFAALSEDSVNVAEVALKTARKYGTTISYDLGYRPFLWKSIGGQTKAQEVSKRLA
jgi:2-dehydro-3-deoxygluconokinase